MKKRSFISLVLAVVLFIFVPLADAERKHPEKYYQRQWCQERGGRMEVVLPDRTRCDCVISTHAIEFDFGDGWAQAIGQSLHYSLQTGKRAGIVLILEGQTDLKYWKRLNAIIQHYDLPISTWKVGGMRD